MQAKGGGLSSASIKIDIGDPLHTKRSDVARKVGKWICSSLTKLWEFCKEDPTTVTFSIKVGLTVFLVSLLSLVREPYSIFGSNAIWAILTVVVVFEQTAGGTIGKGFNRALGSIVAGGLALLVAQVGLTAGFVAQPMIIAFSIFFFGSLATFIKQWPPMRDYESGFRVYLFTFCLLVVSAYRLGNPVRTTVNRLYSIFIGGFIPMIVSVVVFPCWAGEQLHQQIVMNFEYVAESLEECVRLYLEETAVLHAMSKNFIDDMEDCDGEPAFKKYKTALDSSAKEETLVFPYPSRTPRPKCSWIALWRASFQELVTRFYLKPGHL